MFRKNLIIAFALFASVHAFPADKPSIPTAVIADPNTRETWYSTFPLFSIFKPIIELFPNFADIGPTIEIGDRYTKFIVKAEHYNAEELNVQIKGRFVSIEGSKKTINEDRDLASEFLYTASLPINANTSDVFAKFYSDYYLVVVTPTKGLDKNGIFIDRIVPIIVLDELYKKPEKIVEAISVTSESSSPEVTTSPSTLADPVPTEPVTVPEVITESVRTEEITNTVKPTTETETPTTTESATEIQKLEPTTDANTEPVSLEAENEPKTEITEATTPYIEVLTLPTTPYLENEISDLEPIIEQN